MQTAALPPFPEPRRMASRPVSWIADTIAEGAALPVTEMSCALRSAETSLIPYRLMSVAWKVIVGTSHRAYRPVCREMSRPI
jgi:hypothetical protein